MSAAKLYITKCSAYVTLVTTVQLLAIVLSVQEHMMYAKKLLLKNVHNQSVLMMSATVSQKMSVRVMIMIDVSLSTEDAGIDAIHMVKKSV
jgi:hypothetical protein